MIPVDSSFSNYLLFVICVISVWKGFETNNWYIPIIISVIFLLITLIAHMSNVIERWNLNNTQQKSEAFSKTFKDYYVYSCRGDVISPIFTAILLSFMFFSLGYFANVIYSRYT